jgi:acetyltransferase-like isoleucine patch superfamily enzyme
MKILSNIRYLFKINLKQISKFIKNNDNYHYINVSGKNNKIICKNTKSNKFIKDSNITVSGNNNSVIIDEKNTIEKSSIVITGNNNKVLLNCDSDGILNIEIVANNCFVEVGNSSGFTGTDIKLWDDNSKIIFASDCIFAKETRVYCTDFHTIIDSKTQKPLNKGKEIIVGNKVWVGEGVKILKNVNIADNIIVVAGSIVSKNLTESNAIYAGCPASLKKTGVSWLRTKYDISLLGYEKRND